MRHCWVNTPCDNATAGVQSLWTPLSGTAAIGTSSTSLIAGRTHCPQSLPDSDPLIVRASFGEDRTGSLAKLSPVILARRALGAGVAALAMLVGTSAASAASWRPSAPSTNWELIIVTIATHDIDNLSVSSPVVATPTGGAPMIVGLGLADTGSGPGPVIVENYGGSPIRVKAKAGSLSFQQDVGAESSGPVRGDLGLSNSGRMTGISKLYVLGFFANARVSFGALRVSSTSGLARATRVVGTGARSIAVGDATDSGSITEAGLAAGDSIHSFVAGQGLVGGFARDSLTVGAFEEGWSSPDKRGGQSYAASGPGSYANPMSFFAGPPGRWRITWTGAVTDVVPPPLAAWAPVGSYWTLFRLPPQPPTVQ